MTIQDITPFVDLLGSGATGPYPFPFKINAASDMRTFVGGVEKIYPADFSVTGVGDNGGGDVTFTSAVAINTPIRLIRDTARKRDTIFPPVTSLDTVVLNTDNDILVAQVQDIFNRAMLQGVSQEGDWDSRNLKIGNAADGVLSNDLVTVAQLNAFVPGTSPEAVITSIGALRATDSSYTPTFIILTGHLAQGDSPPLGYYWDASITLADNGGTVIKKTSVATGRWIATFTGNIDFRWFGAVEGIGNDNTDAFTRAHNWSFGLVNRIPLYFPPGDWYMNHVDWAGDVALLGASVGKAHSRLIYNGNSSAAGTYLIRNTATNITSFSRVEHLSLSGWDQVLNGQVAETCFAHSPGVGGADLHYHFRNVSFKECWGDALEVSLSQLVNHHSERLRWDSVGGHAVKIQGTVGTEARPITFSKFSWDNALSGNFATTVTTLGYYNGVNWGKGLAHILDPRGIELTFKDGRIEGNSKLIDSAPGFKSLVHSEFVATGGLGQVTFKEVYGYTNKADSCTLVYDPVDTSRFSAINTEIRAASFRIGSDFEESLPGRSDLQPGTYLFSPKTAIRGVLSVDGTSIESRMAISEGQNAVYSAGATFLNKSAVLGESSSHVCVFPTVGHSRGVVPGFITSGASATSGNAVIDLSGDPNGFITIALGVNITILGAGVAGANLDTYVTAVDADAESFTVNDVPSTTIGPTTINSNPAVFVTGGQAGYRTYTGAATPVANLITLFPGEVLLVDFSGTKSWWKSAGNGNGNWIQLG